MQIIVGQAVTAKGVGEEGFQPVPPATVRADALDLGALQAAPSVAGGVEGRRVLGVGQSMEAPQLLAQGLAAGARLQRRGV